MESLVSVIVPYYNHKDFVLETLESIKEQTYKNIEVLIIDDCSPDSGKDIIQSFINKNSLNWTFISNPNNIGLINVLKLSVNYINGDYICILASDDKWIKEKIEVQVRVMESGTFGCLSGGYEEIPTGKIFKLNNIRAYSTNDIIYGDYFMPALNLMWGAERFKTIVSGMKEGVVLEDYYMLLQHTLNFGLIYCLPGLLGSYRVHLHNTSSDKDLMYNKKKEIINELLMEGANIPLNSLDFQTAIYLKNVKKYMKLFSFLVFRPCVFFKILNIKYLNKK